MARSNLTGSVARILFKNNDTGYVIFTLAHKEEHTTVTGVIPTLVAGAQVQVEGEWINHPRFGPQLVAQTCTVHLPTSNAGITAYLGSGLIKGIGPQLAERIVNRFGPRTLTILNTEPELLSQIHGIGPQRLTRIQQSWSDHQHIASLMAFLSDKGISPTIAAKIYRHYGQQTLTIITNTPYRLASDVWGIGFSTADQIAQQIGRPLDDPERVQAGIIHALTQEISKGHLYTTQTTLITATHELLKLETSDNTLCARELNILVERGTLYRREYNGEYIILQPACARAEEYIAHKILELRTGTTLPTIPLPSYTNMLSEEQKTGIHTIFTQKITIITGGPGTGKTTMLKALLDTCDAEKITYVLGAPTGRAAKRISETTGRIARTLHRLLEYDPISREFQRNEQRAVTAQLIIIDESSMIDIHLAAALMRAIPTTAHVVLVGDINQLPPVGPGNFLRDIITSHIVPTVQLTHIFRQAKESAIISNAHKINRGELPICSPTTDCVFISCSDQEQLPTIITQIYQKILPSHDMTPAESIVISPMNKGTAGTIRLNSVIQDLLNPSRLDTHTIPLNYGAVARVGDRVMHIRNNYEKLVFNGDMGIIIALNPDDSEITVQYHDKTVLYDNTDKEELVLAYAITVHKSQGSEYPVVIIPLFMAHYMLLQRALIYTALTRAQKLCILIGEKRALAIGIRAVQNTARNTLLTDILTKKIACITR